ncbi:hypothetical protein DXV75_06420 [Alteromonas aestuariivivens]|uniref:Porin n=1 Tax=Alteromonas aestuariivivens TaxID=1938339 RepID=A0A3D8M9B3_9ALTE|nr:hypothetical protein [Alteromonas aestuariivivens]RDV26623.1 hypothetical protein DXV75_06420 [Alteromonas aestuariivivens]
MTLRPTYLAVCSALIFSSAVYAQEPAETQQLKQEIEQLKALRDELARQASEFERRIAALENQVSGTEQAITVVPQVPAPQATSPVPPEYHVKQVEDKSTWGTFEPGKGFVLARTDMGEVDFSVFTYARYLNQDNFDDTYTDTFGRVRELDIRNDIQMQKLTLNFKGWLFDPKFRYLFYTWTSNTSQGDLAQVVVAGNLGYQFSDAFQLYAGIGGLPSTRSTNYTFPNWLKNDHRSIADEFFRGSYTTGIWASGKLAPGLEYRAMLGNNLSQLGVNAAQLDDGLNTVSAALWWMPTTGEYGPGSGFGDYEYHQELATLFGIHYTHSREDAQGQSDTEGFENSQLRLSDGTLIFSDDPFMTGGDVRKATYEMVAVNGGMKYRGWSLDGEFYYRRLDNFLTTGPIPISSLDDYGFQVQGSTMLMPETLQAFVEYSKIYGDYGNPYDFTLGLNWFPMARKDVRMSFQGLYLKDSPVGYSSVPFAVGAHGWAFSTDLIVAF